MVEFIDNQEVQLLEPQESNPEVTALERLLADEKVTESNQEVTEPKLPATQSSVASYFQCSHQNLKKTWLTPLTEKGYELYEGKKISETGFKRLKQLISNQKESGIPPKEFIASLPSVGELEETAIATYKPRNELATGFEMPELIDAEIEPLDLAILEVPSVADRLDQLVEISNQETAESINEANATREEADRVRLALQHLAKNEALRSQAEASKAKNQGLLDQAGSLLGKL